MNLISVPMIKYNDARIFELITQKLLGTISAQDDVLLQEAIAADEQVKRCWEELYDANIATGHTLLLDLEMAETLPQLQWASGGEPLDASGDEAFSRMAVTRAQGLFWWAFAVLVMLMGALYWYLHPANKLMAAPPAAIAEVWWV